MVMQVRRGGAWVSTGQAATRLSPGPIFDAQFHSKSVMVGPDPATACYPDENPETALQPDDFWFEADPAGSGRQVAVFDSRNMKTQGTTFPRASANTGDIIRAAYHGQVLDEYWNAFSVYFPSAWKFTAEGQWQSLVTTGFGPPYVGSSPARLTARARVVGGQVDTSAALLTFGSYESTLGDVALPYDTWAYVVMHTKHAYQGWSELFWHHSGLGSQPTWTRLPVLGVTDGPAPLAPLAAGVNDGWVTDSSQRACYTGCGVYGIDVCRLYFGHHRVGHSFASVNSTDAGWPALPLPA